jgi:outer membrane usher protein
MRALNETRRVVRFLRLWLAPVLMGAPVVTDVLASDSQMNLQLETFVNDIPAHMIGSYVLFDSKRLGATRNELEEVGLHVATGRNPEDLVMLDEIPSLKYKYVEQTQSLYITVDNALRKGRVFDLSQGPERHPPPSVAAWGGVFNYDAIAAGTTQRWLGDPTYNGASLSFDSRLFSPYGSLMQSGVFTSSPLQPPEFARLNTTYQFSDSDRAISYRAGDEITGALPWTRPLRIGGLQSQRNFALRPDLVTTPLPSLGGIAAVPSTVEVYVNSIRTFTQDVGPGPFTISNIPTISGAGNAQLVLRDTSGRQITTTTPFYASADLLTPSAMEWSLDAGFPRLYYGSSADFYGRNPVMSVSLRRGIYDNLTGQAHFEAGDGLANGGVGAVFTTGQFGLATTALAASHRPGAVGFQSYFAYETRLLGVNVNLSSQRSFGMFDDLASVTARLSPLSANPFLGDLGLQSGALLANPYGVSSIYDDARPPLALDRISFGAPFPFDVKSSVNAGFIHLLDAHRNRSAIVNAGYSRMLPYNSSLSVSIFHDFGTVKSTGVLFSLSIPFGDAASATSSASLSGGQVEVASQVVRPLGQDAGDYGWRIQDTEGSQSYHAAAISYRSNFGTLEAGANKLNSATGGSLNVRGSVATLGGAIFATNWIEDGFAVVNAGAPGVEVLSENRPVGVTGANGMLLVPSLRSSERNIVSVDPANLPVDTEIENTRDVTAPVDHGGVLVNFDSRSDAHAALVTFVTARGGVVPVGAAGRTDAGEDFTVGYDGQVFLRRLTAQNHATIEIPNDACSANFSFTPHPGVQVTIPSVVCSGGNVPRNAGSESLDLRGGLGN